MEGASSRTQQRHQQLKRKLIDMGAKLMAEKGISNCPVEEITGAAGVGKGTFFNIFKNKDDFVFQSLDYWLNDLSRRLSPLSQPDPGVGLANVGGVYLRYFQLRPEVASLLVQGLAVRSGAEGGEIKQIFTRHLEKLAEVIRPACKETAWRENAADLALSILSLSCGFFALGQGLVSPGAQTLDSLSRVFARGIVQE
ncbi:MAG: TetR/AcrR family transcriptional regulator [Desulfarculales bacterium]|jgi:AcrR family transcriptional regulator|nr:TetR/AcrR family transcriptional regulator [Desulfarculales bacterium]